MDDPQEKTVFVPRSSVAQDLFNPGDVVGQYKVERVLGKGGMGVVYLVQHTALKKQFALKALPAVLAQEPAFVARFKREAEMLARLKHNHIVNVTDFGENKGRLYLVLEYVDGGSLEEWFEKHRQPDRGAPAGDVKRLISQILLGLVHAHEAGVIHRDLKPANVLLEKSGEAKISDFGLARAVADEEYRRGGGTAAPFHGDSVTTTGAIVGTIDFMSPEARNMRPSDRRSDVYAVGVIAYYLLTGKKPHGMAQPATKVVPGLDPAWDKFIATCLAEDPTKRYQSALEAHEAIRQIGQSRRGPLRWVALLAAVAAVGVGVGVWKVRSDGATAAGEGGAAPVTTAPAGEQAKGIKTGTEQLPSETNGEPKQESAALRRFTLTGLPAGAVVTYHERNFTVSPTGSVVLALPAGAQPVKVKAPGYQDWEGEIAANEADKEGTVPLQLMPPHTVHFTGLPPKAQLTVDGHTVTADATGAAVVELRPGKFALSAAAPKYEALTQSVDIEAATETLALTMQKLPPPPEVMVTLADGTPLKFKLVPAGSAELGSTADERGRQRNDLPRSHTEFAQPFYLAETEMTQRQHRSLMGKNPSGSRAFGDETRPVEQVAWRDIVGPGGVVEKLNEQLRKHGLPYRADLPTEAEWEYACRAGTTTAYNDGNNLTDKHDDPALNALAFYGRGSTQSAPSPVAKHKPNAWGLYDMHGNVSEWAYGPRGARDPVVRGGNWKVGAEHCRSASRVELTPDTRPTDAMGYRLALHPIED